MRRLIAIAVLALAVPGSASAARLTAPSGYVPAHPFVSSIGAQLELRGRARPRELVEVRTRCALGPCTTTALAGRRGRFTALLNVVVPRKKRAVRVRVGDRAYRLALDQPDYAAFSPYVDNARAPELDMVGDSLAVGTDADLRALLPGWRVTTDAREGRPLAEGMSVLAMTPLPRRPRALAFSLFTNDDPRNVDALATAVQGSLDRLGPRDCAVWATIVRPRVGGVPYREANRRLRAFEDPRLRIVDWARAVGRHRDWLREDGVHPTPEGYAARARKYARAALDCSQSW